MKNIKGNLWDHVGSADIVCITTNRFVKSNGEAVMGRGCAAEAVKRYPGIAKTLGAKLNARQMGVSGLVKDNGTIVATFPVKPVYALFNGSNAVKHMASRFKIGDRVPGWACLASIDIITQSCMHLVDIMDDHGYTSCVLPRPGCGAGELDWWVVEPLLQQYLDDRVSCITF